MKIEEVRPSFTVYLIASELNRLEGIADAMSLAGYMVASFHELTAAFSEFPSNPPHFLVFDAAEAKFNLRKAIKQVGLQLPESHVFLLTPVTAREQVMPLLEQGVYDLIYTPLVSQVELLRSLDRAAERDYFMYMNERLADGAATSPGGTKAEASSAPAAVAASPAPGSASPATFGRNLFEPRTPDESLQAFLRAASAYLGRCPVIYFRWLGNRRVLLATQAEGLEGVDLEGLGVNFNEPGSDFRSASLREPMKVREFTEMVSEVFGTRDFFARSVDCLGELQGVLVFLRAPVKAAQESVLSEGLLLFSKALGLLEAEKRLHGSAFKDTATDVLNRQNFIARIQTEISRARRTNLPVSLLTLTLDQYGQVVAKMGQEEAQIVLKLTARILEKYSRVNDIIGRTGADEFSVLLPHTSQKGGMIKAERLRRILHSADFSKVLSAFPQITVSIGVSEYPSLVRDAEELLQSADEALFQVRKLGNKICLAPAPEGFTPDFAVVDKDAL